MYCPVGVVRSRHVHTPLSLQSQLVLRLLKATHRSQCGCFGRVRLCALRHRGEEVSLGKPATTVRSVYFFLYVHQLIRPEANKYDEQMLRTARR